MHHKNLKLREQFEAQAMGLQPRSEVFRGVTIHVNGYTVHALPATELGACGGGTALYCSCFDELCACTFSRV
jgi:hypothetical protein